MSRHAFRSQPALQRSSGMPSLSLFGLGGLAALGLAVGALVTVLQERRAPEVQTYNAAALAPTAPPAAAPAPAPPPEVATSPPPPMVAVAKPATRTAARPHAVRIAKAPQSQPATTPSPQAAWEEQRQDYEHAVAAYNANESAEGYRWAQQNHIRRDRYCRVAERRTQAFVQGCLSYARGEPAPSKAPG